jgi:hypothetical protein
MIVRPSVLVMYREDHKFLLDGVIPKPGQIFEHYDLVLASQPWRARMGADFKVQKVLAPLARDAREFNLAALTDEKAVLRYEMHTLPSESAPASVRRPCLPPGMPPST